MKNIPANLSEFNLTKDQAHQLLLDNVDKAKPFIDAAINAALQTEKFLDYVAKKASLSQKQRESLKKAHHAKIFKNNHPVAEYYLAYALKNKEVDDRQLDINILKALSSLQPKIELPIKNQLDIPPIDSESNIKNDEFDLLDMKDIEKKIRDIAMKEDMARKIKLDEIVTLFENEKNIATLTEVFPILFEKSIKLKLDVHSNPGMDWLFWKTETNSFSEAIKKIKDHAQKIAQEDYLPFLEEKAQKEFLEEAKKIKLFEGRELEVKEIKQEIKQAYK
jgi:hypothetical protein